MAKRIILFVVFCWGIMSPSFCGTPSYKSDIFNLYVNGEMGKWVQVIRQMEAAPDQTTQFQLQTLQYYYGVIGHFLDKKQNQQASETLKRADSLLNVVERKMPEDPVVYGLKSNFIGFHIALSPIKAPVLFRGMLKNANKAFQTGKDNAFANVLYANILFYMPDMFGGDNNKALDCYKNALSIIEKTPEGTTDNWLYIQLITTIGLVNEKMGNFDVAEQQFKQVMDLEPRYAYVKDFLYPRLQEKRKEKNK